MSVLGYRRSVSVDLFQVPDHCPTAVVEIDQYVVVVLAPRDDSDALSREDMPRGHLAT